MKNVEREKIHSFIHLVWIQTNSICTVISQSIRIDSASIKSATDHDVRWFQLFHCNINKTKTKISQHTNTLINFQNAVWMSVFSNTYTWITYLWSVRLAYKFSHFAHFLLNLGKPIFFLSIFCDVRWPWHKYRNEYDTHTLCTMHFASLGWRCIAMYLFNFQLDSS